MTTEELKQAFVDAERAWCDGWERLRAAEEMRDAIVAAANAEVARRYKQVDELHKEYIEANDAYQEAKEAEAASLLREASQTGTTRY